MLDKSEIDPVTWIRSEKKRKKKRKKRKIDKLEIVIFKRSSTSIFNIFNIGEFSGDSSTFVKEEEKVTRVLKRVTAPHPLLMPSWVRMCLRGVVA